MSFLQSISTNQLKTTPMMIVTQTFGEALALFHKIAAHASGLNMTKKRNKKNKKVKFDT